MLNEEQQAQEVSLTASNILVALQCISRLTTSNGLRPIELKPVGIARDAMVEALQETTGINFDVEVARLEAEQRQRLAQARAAQAEANAKAEAASMEAAEAEAAVDSSDGVSVEPSDEVGDETPAAVS